MNTHVKCPYCGQTFHQSTYEHWHVPCPEPRGDVPPMTQQQLFDAQTRIDAARASINKILKR